MKRDLIRFGILALALAGFACNAAWAQSSDKYPSRPVKILVPYGPGGATDIVARILADQLTKRLGQSVYVENKPGAFGIVALQEMVHAPADGYTLMVGNVSTNAITPVAYAAKLNFDYMKEVVPITDTVDVPAFLVAAKSFAPTTISELVAYVKKNPGQVRYGTVGPGSYPHYDMAYFAKRAGDLDMIAVPNKAGAAGVINDMLTGSVQVAFLNVASSAPQVRAGNLHPLAVVNRARLPEFANLPTMQEARLPRRRHLGVERPVRGRRHAEGRSSDDLRRRGCGDADARGCRSVQQAGLQCRPQQLAGRRQGLARARYGNLAQDHQ